MDDDQFWRYLDDGGKKLVNAIRKAGYDALIYPDMQGYRKFDTTLVFDKSNLIEQKPGGEPEAQQAPAPRESTRPPVEKEKSASPGTAKIEAVAPKCPAPPASSLRRCRRKPGARPR